MSQGFVYDDESIPPPPPPMSPERSTYQEDNMEHQTGIYDTNEFVVASETEDDTFPTYSGKNDRLSAKGQFLGQQNAQWHDEEEAATDEIEVATSRVVSRMNENDGESNHRTLETNQKSIAFRMKEKKIWMMLAVLLVIIVVSLGVGLGTRGDSGGGNEQSSSFKNVPEEGETESPQVTSKEEMQALVVDNLKNDIPGIEQALNDPDSYQAAALEWLVQDPFMKDADFNNEETKLDVKQRFGLASACKAMEANGWMKIDNNWLSDKTVCAWTGVECQGSAGDNRRLLDLNSKQITVLDLSDNGIAGAIPEELFIFESVEAIKLDNNALTGEIPDAIFKLNNLQVFSINDNNITGVLATEFGQLTSLKTLLLDDTLIKGEIPKEIGNLANLMNFKIHRSNIGGSIPTEIGKLSKLEVFIAYMTNIAGIIPSEVGNLSNMVYFDVSNNYLSGKLPDEIVTMGLSENGHHLELLSLYDNDLDGKIPQQIGSLASLQQLSLYDNMFTGSIPASIGFLEKLEVLDLVENKITGSLPTEIGNMIMLKQIYLYENEIDGPIPTQIGNLASLQILDINTNKLTGNLPSEVGEMTTLRTYYSLFLNMFFLIIVEVSLPYINIVVCYTFFIVFNFLETLDLSYNRLTGAIPVQFGSLVELSKGYICEIKCFLFYYFCKLILITSFPSRLFSSLTQAMLMLNNNYFYIVGGNETSLSGEIPKSLGNIVNLGKRV